MVQQLAVTTLLWLLWTVCLVITIDARRHHHNYIFTGDIDHNSSPPPAHQYWLYQGDMKLAEYQDDMVDNPNKKIDITRAFSQGVEEKRIWFRGIIPYVIDCSLKSMPGLVAKIKRAMKEWESKTCVTFVERQDEQDYVTLMRGTHCYSTVGRVKGEKVLSVGHGCEYHNVLLHEIGHTIGFWHEQSRPDRDEHVRVLWRNIRQGWESAFVKLSYKVRSSMLLPYDYSSIMHYPFNAFSKSSRKRTIIALKPVIARPYKKLSKFDILRVNMLYGCKGTYANDVESTTESSSIHAYRRLRRGVEDVEDVELYKSQRKQRSLECKNNDGDEACQYWAEKGFCITRKDFMLTDCAKSCNTCSTDEHYRPSLQPHATVVSYATSVRIGIVERERRTRRRDSKRKARKEVREVYRKRLRLCVDKKRECAYWSSRGFCEARPDLMLRQCRKSCEKCYPDPSNCVDRDSRCKYWAKHHFCRRKSYKTVLKSFCQKSCGHCIPDKNACRDKEYDKCRQWRKHGLCHSRDKEVAESMKIMCARSCGVCGEQKQHEEAIKSLCKDKFKTCKQWQKQGHCKAKKNFMNKFCKESCNTCFTSDNHYEGM
ncbi:zinc metalloproteinase nas-13 isoform X1 [Exaiptasia diaphana]|uniref:Metalloendopeptidase n=1 Tax=Exaiptasia diaphana TaxID=2652724 RepID=A0A913YFL8_EXADI|nr:zinc metalloproteinase nas-13 isoform X1 [Exaiptasia diaphana]